MLSTASMPTDRPNRGNVTDQNSSTDFILTRAPPSIRKVATPHKKRETQPNTTARPAHELTLPLQRLSDAKVVFIASQKNSLQTNFISPSEPSGHYMYRTVVTICTAQWSPYVPHSGHHMYRTVVTICTAQWSLYVPHSGHYMYRTVVTICTATDHHMYRHWSPYVPPGITLRNPTLCPTQCIYVFCVDLRTNSDYFPIQH